jgi:hypothetical protein
MLWRRFCFKMRLAYLLRTAVILSCIIAKNARGTE